MASLPVEILFGLYLGILTGIIPALVSGVLGFLFKYVTNVTIPGLGVVVLSLAIAGANGGLMALNDPTIIGSGGRFVVAIIVVLMLSLYAHSQGDKLGASVPRRLNLRKLTARTLNTDVVELVGGRGQVRVTVSGDVGDMEGYPALPADLRTSIRDGEWTFPVDVPLVELETRFADRLRSEFDLADVSVRLDENARATVSAAPPVGALSKRIPAGKRAVSVNALLPTGLAAGDDVDVVAGDRTVSGTVLSVAGGSKAARESATTDGGVDTDAPAPASASTAPGGDGRVTLAVTRPDAETLLGVSSAERLVVNSHGVRREFELISLLRRSGRRFRTLTVREGGLLDGVTVGEAAVRDSYGVAVFAVRHEGTWRIAPRGGQAVAAGDSLVVVGTREALGAFEEAVA
ncbi:potassium transporter TrkA [Salinigranum rubrum]|uniref:Potassium transporter TrkA n=1 Tax=Salinigranum rubrum TaxID=755307 RepID=A0A2I8VM36_9EURY|nr:TrkA C-terminal domain-containing protein [Salinigranum rubrum]AUV82981.1 potassium transporter TrkA [Salinigranum rubrum]